MATNNDVVFGSESDRHPGNTYWNQLVRAGAMLFDQSNTTAEINRMATGESNVEMPADVIDSQNEDAEEAGMWETLFQDTGRMNEHLFNEWINEDVDDDLFYKLRPTSTLNDLTLMFISSDNNSYFPELVAALGEYQSLKKLSLDFTFCEEDSDTEAMISALCGAISQHPEMRSLTILARSLGGVSSEAIIDLVRVSKLQELRVGGSSTAPQHCASKLVKALEENRHLKILAIPRIGGLRFPDFMKFVLKTPRLECVSLLLSMGDTKVDDDINAVVKMPIIRQEPFVWEVSCRVAKACETSICQLLKAHPEILVKPDLLDDSNIAQLPPKVQFWADFHKGGRHLLERSINLLPLSAWPHVLEQSARRAKSNVIYELLNGPAFAGREGFVLPSSPPPPKREEMHHPAIRKRKSDEMSSADAVTVDVTD